MSPDKPDCQAPSMGCIFLTLLVAYSDLICGFERVQSYHPDKLDLPFNVSVFDKNAKTPTLNLKNNCIFAKIDLRKQEGEE